jgi:NADPH:quinone reductase-like Zn-dependent oxidoreductase
MKAAVLHGPGPAEAFRHEEVPEPQVCPDDVLVDVRACGVSYRDVVERNGTYRRDVEFPAILGVEIAGVVVAVGSAVADLIPGDRVCSKAFSSCGRCRLCRTGRETTCATRRPVRGGYAERVAHRCDAFVKIPPGISFEAACALGPAAGVALNAVRDVARVTIGDTVLVTGASGGVGVAALQLAKLAGANVIAATRTQYKADALREAGADAVVVLNEGEGFASDVRRVTAGEGVDAIIDTVGSRVFQDCFDSLAVHGRYAFVGQLFGENISINPARIFFKRAQLLGVGSVSRVQLEDVVALAAAGRLRIPIARTMPLSKVSGAHRLVESGSLVGRVVVVPDHCMEGSDHGSRQ